MALENKVVLITGAKGGLGTYVTNAFLAAGAKVAGVSRSMKQSDFAQGRFTAVAAEIGSLEGARAVVAEVEGKLGPVEVLVHIMGGFAGGQSVAETDDATMQRMFEMNFLSMFHMARAVVPGMRAMGSGRILAVGSRAALEPKAMIGAYSASKAALLSLVQTLAREEKEQGITANAVLPGTIDTAANRGAMPDADFSCWVAPEQIASMLVQLASAESAHVTGALIPIYGKDL